ncbi:MAG TPA: TRC40/GET3/ArsA family transport-energizing ATPase [Candidatus Deferrimicrobium sp.]|nr:TRC40/GET3/ArsA family transport-energizing ATPase [Candidatus Deferrimicrobium sp.]
MARTLIFTGKGGVGKTTCAAATALQCAKIGKKTLVLSSDPVQALSDCLDVELGVEEPREIRKNLYGLQIELEREIEQNYGVVRNFLTRLFQSRGIEAAIASEMVALPGLDELFSILKISEYINKFEVIVLDTAPTGHTFRLLSFPQVFSLFGKYLLRIQRGIMRIFEPLRETTEQVVRTPIPDELFFGQMQGLMERVNDMRNLLVETTKTTVRVVTNLEKMPILESERALTFMNLYGLNIDALCINKVIPETINDPYFKKWKETQKKYMQRIETTFYPLKLLKIHLKEEEVIGLKLLEQVATEMYGEKGDPTEVYSHEKPFTIDTDLEGNIIMTINLPFVKKGETKIRKKGEELIIEIGDYKRILLLPAIAKNLKVGSARFEEKKLFILFLNKDK